MQSKPLIDQGNPVGISVGYVHGTLDKPERLRSLIANADEKMYEVKRFVAALPPDDRKLFLYYHYIHGETVEKCGELLNVSRRTAYRLKQRALEYAAIKYKRYMAEHRMVRVVS